MKKIIFTISFVIIIVFILLNLKCFAESEVILETSEYNPQKNEEINLTVNIERENIAAYTIWLYYDKEKVECISNEDNLNILEDKIIYTWFSETGKNKSLKELVNIKFRVKQDGVATFNVIAEAYNENVKEIDMKYSQTEVLIGEVKQDNNKDEKEEVLENNVKEDNAFLKIMRVNREGINPSFDKNIKEYYLIVDENVKELDITAIPENNESQVNIIGNKNLKDGLNKIKIKVTSKDKTKTNEYTINVTKTSNEKNANADLEMLAIEYFDLIPEFDKNVTNYSVEVSNEVDKLNILAISSDESAKVDISGNENLKIGNNNIIINITAKDGVTNKKYYLNVHRRSNEEEIKNEEKQQNIIEEANVVLEQMNNSDNETDNNEIEYKNDKQGVNKSIIIIVAIILIMIVIGMVVIRIKESRHK